MMNETNLIHHDADICIIGAGVAGAALACSLANQKLKVIIVEKDWREQDRIVGELMQPDGVEQLKAMQLEHLLDGYDAQRITGYTIMKDDTPLHIAYPEGKYGLGLTNGKFVQKMRDELTKGNNIKRIEAEAQTFIHEKGNRIAGIYCRNKDGQSIAINAKLTIVMDGFFSTFRKQTTEVAATVTGYFLGIVLKDCPLPFAEHGHVFLTESSPFLCYPITKNEIRFLIDFPGNQAPRKSEELILHLTQHVRSRIPESMHHAFDVCMQEGKFKVMPNHYLPGKPIMQDGVVVLGDALNMRHPLTGGGMTVTLRDVNSIQQLLKTLPIETTEERMELIHAFYASRTQNTAVNILADALYKVMSNHDLKDACFNYLAEGGKQAQEPIALLSGIDKSKTTLAKHFFAVAAKGGMKKVNKNPGIASMVDAYYMVGDAYAIIYPLLNNEVQNNTTKMWLRLGKNIFRKKQEIHNTHLI